MLTITNDDANGYKFNHFNPYVFNQIIADVVSRNVTAVRYLEVLLYF